MITQQNEPTLTPPAYDELDTPPSFPIEHLLPKQHVQLEDFLKQHPRFDGRTTRIAIIDSGVDPGAPGLQITSDGKPKIIDLSDPTGAGDVNTATVLSVDDAGRIEGLTGRRLKVPATWTNPSGKYHVGMVSLYDLYPKSLRDRVKKHAKQRSFDPMQRLAVADATRLVSAEEKEGSSTEGTKLGQKWQREDLEARLELLTTLAKKLDDHGPVYDCVVFHDGSRWQACVDTTERGKLEECTVMTNYRDERQHACFGDCDLFSYAVNIHSQGDVLELVTSCGAHGTHVASIAAAHFPDEPERNGVAPGAQLLCYCVGDSRLTTEETGTGFLRAINMAIEQKADIINYSYGEACSWPNAGRIIEAIDEAVNKHGILFVSSAANNGPAYGTLGCPGGTSTSAIAVAAYLTPEMAATMYSVREPVPAMLYPWSSRGPVADGSHGVSIGSLGGAYTSVPTWTLRCSQLMNGTSMSSPHVAGCLATVLSGLRQSSIKYSPASITHALKNTGLLPKGETRLTLGHGIIQVNDMYDFLAKNWTELSDVWYKVQVDGKYRGIYLRELAEVAHPREFSVVIEPMFHDEAPSSDMQSHCEHLVLRCEESWVSHPTHCEVTNAQRQINVRVDPTQLLPGEVYVTEICAYRDKAEELGPIVRIPVTVIVPEEVAEAPTYRIECSQDKLKFNPGTEHRRFIHVPEGASYAILKFRSRDAEKSSRFVFHKLQCLPHRSFRSAETYKLLTVPENGEVSLPMSVQSDRTMELCIVKWWASLGTVEADYDLQFFGVQPLAHPMLTMSSSEVVRRFDVKSSLHTEDVTPAVTLRYLHTPCRPMQHKINALGPRDLYTEGRQVYELVLQYGFNIGIPKGTAEVFCNVPMSSQFLYESVLDCQFWQLFDAHTKRYIGAGDAFPWRYPQKLEKGDYMVKLQIRSHEKAKLEKLKDLPLLVQQKLDSTIDLACYASYENAVNEGAKAGTFSLKRREIRPVYIAGVPDDKLPKAAHAGCYLSGSAAFSKDEAVKKVVQTPFRFYVQGKRTKDASPAKKDAPPAKKELPRDKTEKDLSNALRDMQITWLGKLGSPSSQSRLYDDLCQQHSDHLPLHVARLKALSASAAWPRHGVEILAVADLIQQRVDMKAILEYAGKKHDFSEDAIEVKTEMQKQSNALVEALTGRGNVLAARLLLNRADDLPPAILKELREGKKSSESDAKTKKAAEKSPRKTASAVSLDSSQESSSEPPSELEKSEAEETQTDAEKSEKEAEKTKETKAEDERLEKEAELAWTELKTTKKEVDDVWKQLTQLVDQTDARALPFFVKHALVHEQYGRAAKILLRLNDEHPSKSSETILAELYEKQGWLHLAAAQRNAMLLRYPLDFRPF